MSVLARVGVVGGGIAGLVAARRLAARGDLEVTLWEASERPGGVIATSCAEGFVREHAANGFLAGSEQGAGALAEELGVEVAPASSGARHRWIYRHGALCPVTPRALLGGELLSGRGLVRALAEPFLPIRRGGDDESVADFFRRRLGDEVASALAAPLVTGVFAGDPAALSMAACFPKFAELEAEGGLLRAGAVRAVRRLIAGEQAGQTRLLAPGGGMSELTAALARDLGPRLRLGSPAVAIEVEGGGRAAAVRLASGELDPCDAVVLAVPAPAAARLVSDASGELAALLDQIRFAGVAVVHLGYRQADVGGAARGFGFLVAPGEELRVLGAVFESAIWPGRAPAGHALIRCMLGGVRDPDAVQLPERELVDIAHRDLRRALGLAGAPVHQHVVVWPRAIAQYTIGHQMRVARAEELAEPMGIVLAGSSYHGVAVNRCVVDAGRVVHRVVARLGLPIAVLLAASLAAVAPAASGCSSGTSSGTGTAEVSDDAGGGGKKGRAVAGGAGDLAAEGLAVDVTVEWLDPPAAAVAEAGRNRCGAASRPALAVGGLGGVAGAVVRLEAEGGAAGSSARAGPVAADRSIPQIAIRRCQAVPSAIRLATGGRVALTSEDERRHLISLERIDRAGRTERLGGMPLVVIGQRMELVFAEPGLYLVRPEAESGAFALVAVGGPELAVTDEAGKARFEDIAPGRYLVDVWHPAVGRKARPLARRAEVEVPAGKSASVTVSLAPAP